MVIDRLEVHNNTMIKHTALTVIVIYCTRACSHFHVMFDDSMVYDSCTHISCGVDNYAAPSVSKVHF